MSSEAPHTAPPGTLNIGILMRGPWLAVNRHIARRHAEHGYPELRPAHGAVFQWIDEQGTRVSELAERAGISKQSMAELVKHLEDHGHLERVPDPGDRRAKLVRETAKGKDAVRIARAAIAELERGWARELGEGRMLELRTLLEELNEKLC